MPGKTALLSIDMQYIHVHPDYAVSGMGADPEALEYTRRRLLDVVIPNARRLLQGFRERGGLIVHIVFNYQAPDGSDLDPKIFARPSISGNPDRRSWSFRRRDDPLSAILVEVAPLPNEIVLEKVTHSGFASTNLNNVMINHGIETVVHCGGLTNCCVMHTAIDARKLGYRIACVPEACIARSADDQTQGLTTPRYDAMLTVEEALELAGGG